MSDAHADSRFTIPAIPATGRVALLGGSFNPPHIAHALLAVSVLSVAEVEHVWVLPCADHPLGKELAPMWQRLEMCERAFAPLADQVRVLEIEQRLPKPSFTVQTVQELIRRRPGLRPRLVMGSDILDELHLWRTPDLLEELAPFLVIPRAGYRREGILDFNLPEIASSELRRRIARGEPIRGSVAREVAAFIEAHGLYRPVQPSP